jgi:V/A-type H+/Na+-transporting ATPase subunit C
VSDKNYAYAVTRIRVKENSLLRDSFLQQLLASPDYETALNLLRDHGWAVDTGDFSVMLENERKKTWDLMREVLKEDIDRLDVFLYAADYRNLKAAIKETKGVLGTEGIYSQNGSIEPEVIRKAVSEKRFDLLPEPMQDVAKQALTLFLQTKDGQLSDVIVDQAALSSILTAGKNSGSDFLKLYAETTVASADIKIALRSMETGKDRVFLEKALCPCESLDIKRLIDAALGGKEAFLSYLSNTVYADGIEELSVSMARFERWCDNLLVKRMKPQKSNPFGIDPLAAFVLAKENEITSVRIILSGKRHDLPEEKIRERVREMYV